MSLTDKLRFTADAPLVLLNAPADRKGLFALLKIQTKLNEAGNRQVLLFALNKEKLDASFNHITGKLADDAIFWIAYPKQSGGIESDLIRNAGWETVTKSDHRIVSSAAIDETWSAVRISKKKPADQYKSSVPMEERKVKGIDYVKRTVTLPEDAVKAMKPYKGLQEFFNSMSFSHKREYVEAIEEAKKPETKQRRIEKMIEMTEKLRAEKNKKK